MNKELTKTSFRHLSEDFISDFLYYYRKSKKNSGNNGNEKISLAIAYTNLFINHPRHVTNHHKKMLLKEFKPEEIDELNKLIEEQIA